MTNRKGRKGSDTTSEVLASLSDSDKEPGQLSPDKTNILTITLYISHYINLVTPYSALERSHISGWNGPIIRIQG